MILTSWNILRSFWEVLRILKYEIYKKCGLIIVIFVMFFTLSLPPGQHEFLFSKWHVPFLFFLWHTCGFFYIMNCLGYDIVPNISVFFILYYNLGRYGARKEHKECFVSFQENFMNTQISPNVFFLKIKWLNHVEIWRSICTFSLLPIAGGFQILHTFKKISAQKHFPIFLNKFWKYIWNWTNFEQTYFWYL